MDIATFQASLPEFANTALYPDPAIEFWLGIAALFVGPRYAQFGDYAVTMFTAHNLVLSQQAVRQAAAGGVALTSGPLSGKSIKDLSMTFNSTATVIDGAGPFNLTTYGQRYWQLMELAGAGGIQLGPTFRDLCYGAGYGTADILPLWGY